MHNGQINLQLGRFNNLRQFSGGNRLAESLLGRTRNTDSIAYLDNYVISSKAVAQTRFQWSRLTPSIRPAAVTTTPVVLIDNNDSRIDRRNAGRGSSTSGATDRKKLVSRRRKFLLYVTGALFEVWRRRSEDKVTSLIWKTDRNVQFRQLGDFLANTFVRFRQNFQTTQPKRTLRRRLCPGRLAAEAEPLFSYGMRGRPKHFNDRNNFGPRLAAAWDPFKTGKTVIRAGVGMFYNRALLRTIDDFTLGAQQLFLDTDDIPLTQRAAVINQIRFPTPLTADSPLVRQFGTLNTGFSRRLDPTLRIPESYQANIGIERELPKHWVFEANYTYNRGIHLWREFNVNAPRLTADFKSRIPGHARLSKFLSAPGGRAHHQYIYGRHLVRFVLTTAGPRESEQRGALLNGHSISLVNLNAFTSTTARNAALRRLIIYGRIRLD